MKYREFKGAAPFGPVSEHWLLGFNTSSSLKISPSFQCSLVNSSTILICGCVASSVIGRITNSISFLMKLEERSWIATSVPNSWWSRSPLYVFDVLVLNSLPDPPT